MKGIRYLLVLGLVFSCNSSAKKEASAVASEEKIATSENEMESKQEEVAKGTYLCEINGEKWAYTKASGIVSTHARTKKRTALITFTKKLEKGSESIQLHYDADSFQLIIASLQLKFKNKEGKPFTCYYYLSEDTKKKSPDGTLSGNIDLSDPTAASGVAEILNVNIKYEEEKLLSPENGTISLKGLQFKGIGYSDMDKLSNAFK